MNMNQTKLDCYNKTQATGSGAKGANTFVSGTLMSNWHEEAQLKEDTGYGRAPVPQHIKKKHTDLMLKPPEEIPLYKEPINQLDTTTRLFGKIQPDIPKPASQNVGGTVNRADLIPKVGKKAQLIEQQYLQQIQSELESRQADSFSQTQQRYFETTCKSEFTQKPIENNTIGRRVMRTQNGTAIDADKKDVDLLSDMGFYQKPQLSTDQQLAGILPQESYLTAKPITFYSEKQGQGILYQSKPVNEVRPFHKVDEFVKTFHHFTHVKN
ncbi:unnamed protein product [Paramecium primaurelia]|uniref:Uncharacterized protein n=1 Tax=Paramecium primaurelia TaxID=5886 RepID=A0A8S1NR05_PARPR|nr:unnamed protein product [Paramecium primaurelia]